MMPNALTQKKTSSLQIPGISKEDFWDVFQQMYRNRYFTNHGPLAQDFESLLEKFLDVRNVVSVGNEALALLIAMSGLGHAGKVVMPALGGQLPAQIASWLKRDVVYCDVSPVTYQPKIEHVESVVTKDCSSVVLIETFGNRCDQQLVDELVAKNLEVIVVAFDSMGAMTEDRYVAAHPEVVTVLSFGPGKILGTLQGGAVVTHSDRLAHQFRNTRSSYGVRQEVDVKATCNGRFSEFQAGIGIKSFSCLNSLIDQNRKTVNFYSEQLADLTNVRLFDFPQTDIPNFHCLPGNFGASFLSHFDSFVQPLEVSGVNPVFAVPELARFSNTYSLSQQTFVLPVTGCNPLQAKRIAEQMINLSRSLE